MNRRRLLQFFGFAAAASVAPAVALPSRGRGESSHLTLAEFDAYVKCPVMTREEAWSLVSAMKVPRLRQTPSGEFYYIELECSEVVWREIERAVSS